MSLLERLQAVLPPALADALFKAASRSTRLGLPLFLVGGAVRDLLLERPSFDLDLVVEGEIELLAGALAAELPARAVRHDRFGTCSLRGDGFHLDLARSRRETYSRPGALPSVAPAGISEDLGRRDFSVNAIALRLTPPAGELIDPFSGQADLGAGLIRVLHETSFQDDATRTLRALRFAARLGFALERGTRDLLGSDLAYIETISGARLRQEISLGLAETRAVAFFEAAEARGVLGAIHPCLHLAAGIAPVWRQALAGPSPGDRHLLGWGLISMCGNQAEVAHLSARLSLTARVRRVLGDLVQLMSLSDKLSTSVTNSADAAELLDAFAPEAIWAAALKGGAAAPVYRDYLARGRKVRPLLTGDDVIAAGLPPGPEIGRILRLLRRARIEGRIRDRQGELALVQAEIGRRALSIDGGGHSVRA